MLRRVLTALPAACAGVLALLVVGPPAHAAPVTLTKTTMNLPWYPQVEIDTAAGTVKGVSGGPSYNLVARHSNKCVDVKDNSSADHNSSAGAPDAQKAPVVQFTCNGGLNQQWRLEGAGDGYYRILAQHSGKCLDVRAGSKNDDVRLRGGTEIPWRARDLRPTFLAGAPLLAGNNLATMSTETRDILTNPEVLAVNQDPRGLQGVKVAEDTRGMQVYGKVLSGTGKRAVMLFNRTGSAANITVRWADLGLTTASASVRNAWTRTYAGSFATGYTTSVPANDAVLLTVSGTEASGSTYEDTTTATTPTFNDVTASTAGTKLVDITYANGGSTARKATIQVNGQYKYVVSFPPTGSATTYRTVSVLAHLAKGANIVKFAAVSGSTAPDIDALRVQGIPGTDGTALVGSASDRCLDIEKNTYVNATQAQLWDCSGGRNQTFTHTSRGELVVYGNKCLEADDSGTKVVIGDCTGGTSQKWTVNSGGTITNNLSGLCLDASGAATANGTRLILWTCNGQANQKWTLT